MLKRRIIEGMAVGVFIVVGIFITYKVLALNVFDTAQDIEFEVIEEPVLSRYEQRLYSRFPDLKNWTRPAGPIKVALQVGHWKNAQLPDELERLRGRTVGASAGGYTEWQVMMQLAEQIAPQLEARGIEVDILPATVPPAYWADLFVALHADGSTDTSARGFKASGPYRDYTGEASRFVEIFTQEYAAATGLRWDSNITRNMRGYYAFNWFRYQHSIHPMTTGVILETGFLTNSYDRNLLVQQSEKSVQGIVNSIIRYFDL